MYLIERHVEILAHLFFIEFTTLCKLMGKKFHISEIMKCFERQKDDAFLECFT